MAKIEEARERKISSESNTTPEKKVGSTPAPSSDENKNNSNSRHDLFTLIFNSTQIRLKSNFPARKFRGLFSSLNSKPICINLQ